MRMHADRIARQRSRNRLHAGGAAVLAALLVVAGAVVKSGCNRAVPPPDDVPPKQAARAVTPNSAPIAEATPEAKPPVQAGAPVAAPSCIAEKYPGDRDIADDPAVVFAEDFEDDDLKARGWYDLNGWGKRLVVTDEDKATGAKCLKLVYPSGSTGPWFRAPHFPHGHRTLYVRYYRKWADGWNWGGPGDGNGHDTRLVANGPGLPTQAYKAKDTAVLMMESCTHFAPWRRGLFGLMLFTKKPFLTDAIRASRKTQEAHGHRLRGGEWWLATVDRSRSPKSPPGRWFCVEYMGTLNTPGEADGEIKGWIDGELVYHVENCTIRDGAASDATWRRWWVGPYFHGGTTRDQHSYLDSVVVATAYVGPVRRTSSHE